MMNTDQIISTLKAKYAAIVPIVVAILSAVLAFFSYQYYMQRKADSARVVQENTTNVENEKVIEDDHKEVVVAQAQVEVAVQKAEDIQLKPTVPTPDVQASVDEWNKN